MLTLSLILVCNTLGVPGADRFLFLPTDHSGINAWISPLLYTSFNLGMAQAVLVPLARHTDDERALVRGGILGGAGIGFMLLAAHFAMSSQMPGILQFEIPMGSIAIRLGPVVQMVFLLLIFMEIFSTFVAGIYGVSVQLQQRLPVAPALVAPLLMLICYVFSQFGFSSLLGIFYPIFGALCLIWVVMLVRSPMSPPPGQGKPPAGGAGGKKQESPLSASSLRSGLHGNNGCGRNDARHGFSDMAVAGHHDDLPGSRQLAKQSQGCVKPVFIEVHEQIIEEQRQIHLAAHRFCQGQPDCQIQLLRSSPAEQPAVQQSGILMFSLQLFMPQRHHDPAVFPCVSFAKYTEASCSTCGCFSCS